MSDVIFKGIYKDFGAAKKVCNSANLELEYPQEIWKRRQLSFLADARLRKPPRPEILSSFLKETNIKRVFDYGGGSGWTLTLMQSFGFKLQEKVIIETSESKSWFKHLNPSLCWLDQEDVQLLSATEGDTILYSNSCVQYLENYKKSLRTLIQHDWKYLIFEDLPNFPDRDFWTLQQYYGYSTPYHFFKLEEFIKFVEFQGYQLVLQQDYIDEFPESWKYEILEHEIHYKPSVPKSLVFISKRLFRKCT